MNPIHTQELHTMRVHVFASEADRLAAQAEGLVSQDDLVLTPDTGESLFEDMQAATDAANAAIARAEELSQEFEDALSGGILQGPPGPQGTPGTDGADGENGATFTPSLSDEGVLSWTNDQGLQNPAAVSMGERRGSTWEHRSGKRTRISRTTAGQAELMTGRGREPSAIIRRVASDTSSAARETSNTSSKPSRFRPVRTKSMSSRLLNCPYSDGAGRAMV